MFDSNEVLETKLLTGNSGYDVVVPSAYFLERQIKAGVFRKLDYTLLPSSKNLDPALHAALHAALATFDPGNEHAVGYLWGTTGIGYDARQLQALAPDAPTDSWRLAFDPKVVAAMAGCGVSIIDAPSEVIAVALIAQGKVIVNPGGKAAVAALDPDTGKVLWQGEGGNANYSSFIAGTFGGVEQVVGFDAKSLGGWSVEAGKRLWRLEIESSGGYVVPTPVRVGNHLLIADLNNPAQLYAFDQNGKLREPEVAANEDVTPEISTPVVVGDLLLAQYETIYCVDLKAGLKKLWIIEREEALEPDCHLIVAENRGLAFNNQGVLTFFRFDRQGIRLLGQKKLCNDTLMHPTVSGPRLFVRDNEFVRCYDLSE